MPASWPASRRCGARARRRAATPARAAPRRRNASRARAVDCELDLVVEHARDPLHDRQPEAEPARDLGALVEPVKLAEDRALLRLRDAEAGVVDVDAQAPRARRQPTSTRPCGVYLIGVRDEVLQQPPQQPAVGPHRRASTARTSSCKPFSRASGANSTSSWRSISSMRKLDDLRLHRAGIEPRDVEQRAEDFLDRFERGIDVADELRVLAAALALDQAGDVEPRRVERLQDVVACGGEEARLGDVGFVGLGLGARERDR